MKEEIKEYLNEFSKGTKTMFKEFFKKDTNKKQRANMWTFSRLIISLPILLFSIMSAISFSAPLLITNSLLVAFGAITDFFDGRSARKHKSTSEYGKKLDQITDKIFSVITGISLVFINPLFVFPIFGEGLIMGSTLPYTFKYKNLKDNSAMVGRIKQWPLGVAFFLGYLTPLNTIINTITTIIVAITLLLQVATALTYLKRNIDTIEELNKKDNSRLLELEEDFEKDNVKEKVKTIDSKSTTTYTSKPLSRKEQLQSLRLLLDEVRIQKQATEEKNKEKVKK